MHAIKVSVKEGVKVLGETILFKSYNTSSNKLLIVKN